MFETAEGLGVGDAVHIPLEAGADLALRLRDAPPAGILRQHAAGPDDKMLELFSLLTGTGHYSHSFPHINRKKEQGDLFPLTLYTTQKCISLYFFEIFMRENLPCQRRTARRLSPVTRTLTSPALRSKILAAKASASSAGTSTFRVTPLP